jgi:hypothetical protein
VRGRYAKIMQLIEIVSFFLCQEMNDENLEVRHGINYFSNACFDTLAVVNY